MKIRGLDHLVLTVRNLDATTRFYTTVLGMRHIVFDGDRHALTFGTQKINLHQVGAERHPGAIERRPGTADRCFEIEGSLTAAVEQVRPAGVSILEGPVRRSGACGSMQSVYVRDPDGNLVEVSTYDATPWGRDWSPSADDLCQLVQPLW